MMSVRRWIQVVATFLSNGYLMFPFTRNIYQGRLKSLCLPGLNCYSCPAATGACPLGSLQTFLANVRPGFDAGKFHPGFYVIGTLGLIGSLAGRMPCAWLCPFGFLQELIHKIPSRKLEIPSFLSRFKYIFLVVFVVLLPLFILDPYGYGTTWFCKHICPAGTLEAGLPMLILQPSLRDLVGVLFYSKLTILFILLAAMVFIRRPFCRMICPLGAIYSLFNRASIFRMIHDPGACVKCKKCYLDCPMGVKFYEGANQPDCIRCLKCYTESCRYGAISLEFGTYRVMPGLTRKKDTLQESK
jgi:polyferredoxin